MRRLIVFVVLGLLVAACGGDSGDGTTETSAPESADTTAAPESDDSASDDTPAATTTTVADSGGDSSGSDVTGVGVGTATIAGETYEFGDMGRPGLQCMPDAFGVAFLAALEATGGDQGTIVVGIPFPGEEETSGIMPELEVTIGDVSWMANEERAAERDVPAGSSQVDSYEINGNTITGTATFYDEDSLFTDELIVEEGTFEVTCAGG